MSAPLLFRFHRGGFKESMETVVEIKSYHDFIVLIYESWDVCPLFFSIKNYVYDPRIDWDTHIVCISFEIDGELINGVVGYFNREPEWDKLEGAVNEEEDKEISSDFGNYLGDNSLS